MNHAESLHNDACFIVITTAVNHYSTSAWLKMTKIEKDDENCVLPGCRFATLVMLLGDVDVLFGKGRSIQKQQASALKRVKPILG